MTRDELMEKTGTPIPPELLEDYLNVVRWTKKFQPGLHEKRIIITRDSRAQILNLFAIKTVNDLGVQIEVRS